MAISHFVAALPTVPLSIAPPLSCVEPNSFSVPTRKPIFRKQSIPAVSPSHRIVCLQAVEELPPKLQNIVKLFEELPEVRSKFKQVLQYGKNKKPLAKEFKSKENKVAGCASQVWVRAFMDDMKVYYEADSDSGLARGVASLLVEGLSGCSPAQILGLTPDFIQMLGCTQRSTPSRNNGFLNTLKLMQRKALQLYMEAESAGDSNEIHDAEQSR
jgi:sulfur transfer protein SufE